MMGLICETEVVVSLSSWKKRAMYYLLPIDDTHTVKATDSDEPAIPVFAAAKKSLEMFIKAYKPKDINFSGAEKLGSIYERMLKKFLKDIPSYKLVSQKPAYDESAIEFKLSRV